MARLGNLTLFRLILQKHAKKLQKHILEQSYVVLQCSAPNAGLQQQK